MTAATVWAEAMKYEHRADPYPFFDQLRRTPVARVADDQYVVTGYWEVLALTHDPRISSDIGRSPLGAALAAGPVPDAGARDGPVYEQVPSIIVTDPPEHDRARQQVMRHFGPPHAPDVIPGTEPGIVRLCNELLDNIAADGRTRLDVVDDYAYPVPVTVICEILGIPVADEPTFHVWIHDMLTGTDLGPDASTAEGKVRAEKARAGRIALTRYLTDLIERVRREPRPGLLSAMIHDDGPAGPMPLERVLSNARLLLVAGHDSTVNTISNCVLTLLRNPGTYERVRSLPELIPRAIEEVQRLQAAVQFFPSRSATADIDIAGITIPKGAAVHLVYAAANRDPKRFADPDRFDIGRPDNEHFGWGSGIHTCIGGPLARLEVNLALETFVQRVAAPGLVVDPPPYRRSQIFRGPRHLLVQFDHLAERDDSGSRQTAETTRG
ncbi:cytochrome P450 [Nocardia speluncae]|uniref:Cytochrome P450 n=1 Tax=Nocardia speluncae TaxID=419477 RepID=A0A846XEM7_9NOCA|nr:cytochrome P450 [Nocardia speluncae]NKY33063.1 cytochrome P450 [Nocardia speluncae]